MLSGEAFIQSNELIHLLRRLRPAIRGQLDEGDAAGKAQLAHKRLQRT